MRIAISTSSSSTPRRRRKTTASASRRSIAAPSRAVAPVAAPVVSQHLGLGAARPRSRRRLEPTSGPAPPVAAFISLDHRRFGAAADQHRRVLSTRTAAFSTPRRRRGAVHLQRDQRPARLRPRPQSRRPYVKDAFHRNIIHGEDCLNPDRVGTKACLHYRLCCRARRRFGRAAAAPDASPP